MSARRILVDSVLPALRIAADPAAVVTASVSLPTGRWRLLAVGKAAVTMARATLALPGTPPEDVFLAAPADDVAPDLASRGATIFPCDHPLPTHRNTQAARAVLDFVGRAHADVTLLVLLSGGGSAYLALPHDSVPLEQLTALTRHLQRAGASIHELNAVRKHAEQLKGGRLALPCAGPVRVELLSDVIGDPLDVVSSGPFAPDPTTFAHALSVLQSRGGLDVAPAVTQLFRQGVAGALPETPKPGDAAFRRVSHRILANNSSVVAAAEHVLRRLGFTIAGVEREVEGDAAQLGDRLGARAASLAGAAPAAWILGGEWVVNVGTSTGEGGPSQELALAAAGRLAQVPEAAVLAFSTDGRDGPGTAAGAVVETDTWSELARLGVDSAAALRNHDSGGALSRARALLSTGPTGTNLNHVAVLAVGTPISGT